MKKLESFWEEVKGQIKKQLPDHCYRMWIDPVELLDYNDHHVQLAGPNAYFVKRLKNNYVPILKKEFSRMGFENMEIELTVSNSRKPVSNCEKSPLSKGAYAAVPMAPKKSKQMDLPGIFRFNNGRLLKKGYTFNDFVVGENSNFAYSASLSLAQGQIGGTSILYLLADTGLGKSHLSQAAGHHIIKHDASCKVYYVTAEDFTNEMISSIKNKTIDSFKKNYREKCDVLILEDVQFLTGKDATQTELALTLDYLLDAEKKVIFSGCELPDEIPKLNEQLRSRLNLGLITKIDAPDFNTRVRILRKKSKEHGYDIPTHVTDFIAQELTDDVRQLESGLFGVAAKGKLMGYNIDIELAKSVISYMKQARKRITIESIKQLVCNEFSISEKEIVSNSRKKRIVKPRQMAIYLSRQFTDHSIKKIGSSFNKYHATAIYSINAVQQEIKQKGMLYEQVKYLSKKIESGKF